MYHPKQSIMKEFLKVILILASLLPLVVNAQMVKTTVEVDEFDNSKTFTTERWSRFAQDEARGTLSAMLLLVDEGVISLGVFYTKDLGCLSQNRSTLEVKLANGEVVEFTQFSRTDCSNSPSAFFIPVGADELKSLSVEEVKTLVAERYAAMKEHDWSIIRLRGTNYYTDLKPLQSRTVERPEQFFRLHLTSIEEAVANQ